jgi:hypothetical protein
MRRCVPAVRQTIRGLRPAVMKVFKSFFIVLTSAPCTDGRTLRPQYTYVLILFTVARGAAYWCTAVKRAAAVLLAKERRRNNNEYCRPLVQRCCGLRRDAFKESPQLHISLVPHSSSPAAAADGRLPQLIHSMYREHVHAVGLKKFRTLRADSLLRQQRPTGACS